MLIYLYLKQVILPSEELNSSKKANPHPPAVARLMLFSLFLWFLSERRAGGECSAGREEEHMVLVLLCSHMLPGLGGGGMGASQGVSLLQYIPRSVGLVPVLVFVCSVLCSPSV